METESKDVQKESLLKRMQKTLLKKIAILTVKQMSRLLQTCRVKIFSSESNMEGTFSCVKPLHEAHHEATFSQGSSEINPLDNPPNDMSIKDPVVIEIFCGSSRVTACLKAIGLTSSFGVDRTKVKAVSTCKIADLSCASGH